MSISLYIPLVAMFCFFVQIKAEIEMKGMTYTTDRYCNNVTLDSPRSFASLYHLRTTGANYVAFVVTEFIDHAADMDIHPIYEEPFPDDG